MSDPSKSM